MKFYVNRSPVEGPWGGGAHFTNALHRILPVLGHAVMGPDRRAEADVIIIAGLDQSGPDPSAERIIAEARPSQACIFRINDNDARKGTAGVDRRVRAIAWRSHGVVYVSRWIRSYFGDAAGGLEAVIVNGVDRHTFVAGTQPRTGPTKVVAHHWSDNRLKGFDVYELIDELVGREPAKYSFTYIGRHRNTFKHAVTLGPLYGRALGTALAGHDVYVSASRFDPGPNHVIESITSGLPTYVHAEGGGCVEFAGDDHVYGDWKELSSILSGGTFTPNRTAFGSWEDCVKKYVQFIDGVLSGSAAGEVGEHARS